MCAFRPAGATACVIIIINISNISSLCRNYAHDSPRDSSLCRLRVGCPRDVSFVNRIINPRPLPMLRSSFRSMPQSDMVPPTGALRHVLSLSFLSPLRRCLSWLRHAKVALAKAHVRRSAHGSCSSTSSLLHVRLRSTAARSLITL